MNEKMEKLFDLMKVEKSAAELTSIKDAENARRWLSGHILRAYIPIYKYYMLMGDESSSLQR